MTTKLVTLFSVLASLLLLAVVSSSVDAQDFNEPEHRPQNRVKRMYAVCPPEFQRIGNECYFISRKKETWMEAHFKCVDRDSKLAEPFKFEDKRLRKYLLAHGNQIERSFKWIGGIYNWQSRRWHWGQSGRNMTYKAFSQMQPGSSQDLKYHCAVLSPEMEYRWSSRLCTENQQYVCQHRMPYVNKRQLDKVYARWNVTFPNQKANEMEVIVTDPNNRRHNQLMRLKHKRRTMLSRHNSRTNHTHQKQPQRVDNDLPVSVSVPVIERRQPPTADRRWLAMERKRQRQRNEVTELRRPAFVYGRPADGQNKPPRRHRKRPTPPPPPTPSAVENEILVGEREERPTTTETPVSTTLSTSSTTLPTTSTSTERPTPTTIRTTTESAAIPTEHPHRHQHHNQQNHHHHHPRVQVGEEQEKEHHEHLERNHYHHENHHQEEPKMDNEVAKEEMEEVVIPVKTSTPATTTSSPTTTTTSTPSPVTTSTPSTRTSDPTHTMTKSELIAERKKRLEDLKRQFSKMTKPQQLQFLAQQKELKKKLQRKGLIESN